MLRRKFLIAAMATMGIAFQANAECTGFGSSSSCSASYSPFYTAGGSNLVNLAISIQNSIYSPYSASSAVYPYGGSYGGNWGGSCASFSTSCQRSYSVYGSPYGGYGGYNSYGGFGSAYGYPYGSSSPGYGTGYGAGYGYGYPYSASAYGYPYGSTYGGSSYGGSAYGSGYGYPYGSSSYGYPYLGSQYGYGYPGYGSSYYPSYGGGLIYNRINIFIDLYSPTTSTTSRTLPPAPTWTSCGASWDPCPAGPTDRDPVNDPPDTVTSVPPIRYQQPRGFGATH